MDVVLYQVLQVSKQHCYKTFVSVVVNLCCADNVCLCSVDYMSGAKKKTKK